MPFLIEHVTEVVLAILLVILLGNAVLVATAFARRQRREKYFQRIDEMRQRYGPVVAAVVAGRLDYERGLALLKSVSGLDREFIWEQLLVERTPTAAQLPTLRRLCEDLGLVKLWQRHLRGQFEVASLRDALSRPEGILQRVGRLGFLLRARSAKKLGLLRHQPSWPLLVKALHDPHSDVQVVAVQALGSIGEPQSFPALVEHLHAAILNPSGSLSLRSIKAVLVTFPLSQAVDLLPSLQHAHRRIRFFATDIIREMVERDAAPEEEFVLDPKVFRPELAELFLTQLCFDENPDVRARAAPVIAYLGDPRSTPVLLTLLEDREWFGRLHTLRALAKRKFMPEAGQVARCLSDSHWMVREAAARTLLVFGRIGIDELSAQFLNTPDRYTREQIADEMQRAGFIPTLVTQYGSETDGRQTRVIERLAEMGKTSYLLVVLVSNSDRDLRKKFLRDFGQHPDPQIRGWVEQLAARESDPEVRALARAALLLSAKRGES